MTMDEISEEVKPVRQNAKVVIDTHVIVSSLIQHSYPYLLMYELFVEDKFHLCVSDQMMVEYYEVLARPRFENLNESHCTQEYCQ